MSLGKPKQPPNSKLKKLSSKIADKAKSNHKIKLETTNSTFNSENIKINFETTNSKLKSDDYDVVEFNGGAYLNKINADRIGVKSKKILREFLSKKLNRPIKRLTQNEYIDAVKDYNVYVVNERKVIKNLPYVEIGPTKEQRIKEQKLNFIVKQNRRQVKDFENKFIDMRIKGDKSITIKINKKLSLEDNLRNAINTIENVNKDQKFNLIVNKRYYALNENTKKKLLDLIIKRSCGVDIDTKHGSDAEVCYILEDIDEFTLEVYEKKHKNKKHNGAFFKYINKTKFDLEKYQIFKKIVNHTLDYTCMRTPQYLDKNVNGYYDNCLIYALRILGLENAKLEALKLVCKVDNIPLCELKNICEKYEICIKVTREKYSTDKSNIDSWSFVETFGNENNKTFNIGLLDEHYFINEQTDITSYSIINYDLVKNLKEFHLIYKKRGEYYKRDKNRTLMSYDVIKLLLKHKDQLLEPISKIDMVNTQLYKYVDDNIKSLEYQPLKHINYKPIEPAEPKYYDANITNIYFDFETYLDMIINEHIAYLCCYIDDNNNKGCFYGVDCGLEMLLDLSKKYENIRLIAHNVTYDSKFLYKYLYEITEITKGTQLMSCNAKFNKLNIILKDSYSLLSMPLSNFPKSFRIANCVKEVISYNFYNKTDAIKKVYVKISDTIEFLKNEEKNVKQFEENLKKWNLIIDKPGEPGEYYNCIEYAKKYCEMDCYILREGYNKFKGYMLDLVNINIDNVISIASLAHKYFIQEGCYEGVNEIGGVPQAFIQKCVVGGRTMTNDNNKIKLIKKTINDLDAVSLYPSAMYRMDGFLKGLPKVITNLNFEDLKNKDGYFIEIKITKVGIKRNFPLSSYITENGIRNWTNDVIGRNIYIDKISLEDLIKFQNVEFDIIRGYYFDEGFNTKINSVIKKIFDERKKLKENKNSAEIVYKLIMNSGYGKSIMKEIETETKYFNKIDDADVYVSRNYNWVIYREKLKDSNTWKVKIIKSINDHFNIAQVGVSILSWSKRIMNEVICLAEDNDIPIYYQDTDSLHIDNENIKKLATLFKNEYNRELIGKNMGQFHSDFNMVDYIKLDEEGFEDIVYCKDVIAVESIFLGKKCYIDKLEGIKENGEKKIDYHIRMKGVPTDCIKWTAEKLNIDVFELYIELYNGKEICFDLTQGGSKVKFKYETNGTIKTLQEFIRKIKFD